MRNITAGLTGEQKVFRCVLLPLSQCVRSGQMIERVVDFDRAQVAGIAHEKLLTCHS